VPEAIRKAVESAKKHLITVPMVGTTIPHEIRLKKGAAKVLLKPAAPGTGIRSGGAMRAVVELSGIKDMITKSLGTNNPVNTVRATIAALQALQTADSIAQARGKGTLFAVLSFPVLLPLLLLAVELTRGAFAGGGAPGQGGLQGGLGGAGVALMQLLLYDGAVTTAGLMLFPVVWNP